MKFHEDDFDPLKTGGATMSDLRARLLQIKDGYAALHESEKQRLRDEIERLKPLAELGRRVEAMPLGGELRRLSEAAPWHYWPVDLGPDDAHGVVGLSALEALQAAGIGD